MIRSTSSFNAVRRIIGICEFSARMSRQISRPDPSGNMTSSTINLMSFDSSATLRVRLSEASVTRNPCSARYRPSSFLISRSSSTIRMCDSTCTRYVLIETALNRLEQLSMAFNEEAVKSPFPATLRHIAVVPGQRSDTDGPNFENSRALSTRTSALWIIPLAARR